jgi:hypothetical protein
MINALKQLNEKGLEVFWQVYLAKLSKSIKVGHASDPEIFSQQKGWDESRDGYSWDLRAYRWYRSNGTFGYDLDYMLFVDAKEVHRSEYGRTIPMFPSFVKLAMKAALRIPDETAALDTIDGSSLALGSITATPQFYVRTDEQPTINNENKTMKTIKNTAEQVMNSNKEAVKIAAKLATGKTANSFFLSKLLGKFPWWTKFFSKKNDVANNPIAKLVAAETAATLVAHFAPDNAKLKYISEGMVQEAVVDLTVNSAQLERMIDDLESMITLPKDLL